MTGEPISASGDADDAIRSAPRVCFFAHFHPAGIVSDAVLIQLAALRDAGFAIVVLSTAALGPEQTDRLVRACAVLVRRDNHGLDFGGWQDAAARFFPLRAELLLLANDSVYGPIGDFGAFLDKLLAVPADVYGAVETTQFTTHLQSWFMLLRPSAYRSETFARFMADRIAPAVDKWDVITRFEMALTPALAAEGLTTHAAYRPSANGLIAAEAFFTPTQPLWRELIAGCGVPFVKIELLRDRPIAGGGVGSWPAVLRRAGAGPHLLDAIRDDLALRRALAAPRSGGAGAFAATLYWAMMRGFLRRDFRPGGAPTPAQRRNAALFRALKKIVGKTPQPARQSR